MYPSPSSSPPKAKMFLLGFHYRQSFELLLLVEVYENKEELGVIPKYLSKSFALLELEKPES